MTYFISAYATSPTASAWEPDLEADYFRQLANASDVVGIEHPFLPNSARYPLSWLAENIPAHWSLLITTLPLFMNNVKDNPLLGLASSDESSRRAALSLMEQLSDFIGMINETFNRSIVRAVHFHSFPKNGENKQIGNKAALKQSLEAMKKFNWQGAQLNLEHCDAYVKGQSPEKGLLHLSDEIEVLTEIGEYGIVLNWARSAIEGRSAQTALAHIEMAARSGLLRGFFFSGCSNKDESQYGAWKDSHMPPQGVFEDETLQKESLLGAREIAQTLERLNAVEKEKSLYHGIKVFDIRKSRDPRLAAKTNLETVSIIEKISASLRQVKEAANVENEL